MISAIVKILVVLVALFALYVCIYRMRASSKILDETEGTPMDVVEDVERPRSQLIKTIEELRKENAALVNRIKDLEKGK